MGSGPKQVKRNYITSRHLSNTRLMRDRGGEQPRALICHFHFHTHDDIYGRVQQLYIYGTCTCSPHRFPTPCVCMSWRPWNIYHELLSESLYNRWTPPKVHPPPPGCSGGVSCIFGEIHIYRYTPQMHKDQRRDWGDGESLSTYSLRESLPRANTLDRFTAPC